MGCSGGKLEADDPAAGASGNALPDCDFQVTLKRSTDGESFGMELADSEKVELQIKAIDESGLLAKWNKLNEDWLDNQVFPGDLIVAVNEVCGDLARMRGELEAQAPVLRIRRGPSVLKCDKSKAGLFVKPLDLNSFSGFATVGEFSAREIRTPHVREPTCDSCEAAAPGSDASTAATVEDTPQSKAPEKARGAASAPRSSSGEAAHASSSSSSSSALPKKFRWFTEDVMSGKTAGAASTAAGEDGQARPCTTPGLWEDAQAPSFTHAVDPEGLVVVADDVEDLYKEDGACCAAIGCRSW
eukprot:TRINITY_DN81623_c0_g1_i1.p1 TRINITY_DN81623_c0_g1~~TRINITY_DN81623_c0_g1_i1.p1  ORF type:complete len:300 (+),score=87.23 TRINITY_DN81623_c0_g1_i1:45-944(+)